MSGYRKVTKREGAVGRVAAQREGQWSPEKPNDEPQNIQFQRQKFLVPSSFIGSAPALSPNRWRTRNLLRSSAVLSAGLRLEILH